MLNSNIVRQATNIALREVGAQDRALNALRAKEALTDGMSLSEASQRYDVDMYELITFSDEYFNYIVSQLSLKEQSE
jgi:hypothetical protein|tara:strand:+ start:1130 stop:1360 length:231 start_codon:yes stop_codon:yes gene_type:complete